MKTIIVGGGIMGLSTAWGLAREGHEVELFEQGPLPNPLASSVDQHRLIRHPYGDHAGYARMIDEAFIAEYTEGWEQLPAFLADYPPSVVAELTGIDEADLHRAARLIGEAGNWMSCWTMGLNQSTHGTWNTNALINLHLATGAICRPGSGPFSLTGQPNAMGGREMGYMGPGLPGQREEAASWGYSTRQKTASPIASAVRQCCTSPPTRARAAW